jgi:iron complex transport system permease protein
MPGTADGAGARPRDPERRAAAAPRRSGEIAQARSPASRSLLVNAVGALLLLVLGAASLLLGAAEVEPSRVLGVLLRHLSGGEVSEADRIADVIVWSLRLPRTLLAAMVGASLAVSGALLQGLFRNPLASPSIIGASEGAAFGAVLALSFGLAERSPFVSPLLAILGAFGALWAVVRVATRDGRSPVATLLLAGVALSALLSAVNTWLIARAWEEHEAARRIAYWLMGGIADRGWIHVGMLLPGLLLGILVAQVHAKDLDRLLEGEETASALGVEVERAKTWLLAAAALLVGSAVAVSGVVGFVGLVVPHLVRLTQGASHRLLLPASAITGAWLVIAADLFARTAVAPRELHLGVVTSFLGAPFFLYLLRRHRAEADL